MERKVFLIINSMQKQVVIDSKAETLGQLKEELKEHDIDYNDMTFFEGRTKVELKSDDTILPSNFSFKGAITNDLTIMLTKPHKKIKSGIMTRQECYNYIKENNLSAVFTEVYNKNYTNASTLILNDFCNTSKDTLIKKEVIEEEVKTEKEPINEHNIKNVEVNTEYYLKEILNILKRLDEKIPENMKVSTVNKFETEKKVENLLSEDEISEMFDFI